MLASLWHNRERPPRLSRPWFKNWAKRIATFPSLVASVLRLRRLRSKGARIGSGTFIAPALVSGCPRLSVAENSFIGRVEIQAHAEVRIGSYVCLNDGVRLITASHNVRDSAWSPISKSITIEDFAWIATGATILPGVKIGRGAVVGACSVVSSDVPPYAIATGNPARIRENVRPTSLNYSPLRLIALYGAWLGNPPATARQK